VSVRLSRLFVPIAVAAAIVAGCGSSSKEKPATQPKATDYQGGVANPPKPAPPLRLRDSTGKRFDLATLRGKAVLISFQYVNCPDECPLMTANLHTALKQLGPEASKVQVVGVSTDPKGDKPKAVNEYLAKHQVTDEMRYLIGSKSQLAKVWKAWGIVSKPDPSAPGKVGHSALTYGISASGKITTLYPSNFGAAGIAHDTRILIEQ
jgi:protein SCO1/2